MVRPFKSINIQTIPQSFQDNDKPVNSWIDDENILKIRVSNQDNMFIEACLAFREILNNVISSVDSFSQTGA